MWKPFETDAKSADGKQRQVELATSGLGCGDAFAATLKGTIALGRYGQTDEIAVSYLASPEAGYIAGASLKIDGGFAA